MTPAQLLQIGLPIWLGTVFLFHPVIAAAMGAATGYAGAVIDPEQKEYFLPLPSRIYRHTSLARRTADLAYVKKLLDEELAKLKPEEREAAKEYLRSLGYERVSL